MEETISTPEHLTEPELRKRAIDPRACSEEHEAARFIWAWRSW